MKTAVTFPMDAATTTFFRTVLGTVNQVLASYDPAQLEEPWKTHYLQIKSDYDSALKDLPPTDQAPLALNASNHLQCLYSMLSNTSAMCSYLKSTMASMKPSAEVLASAVETGVAQGIASGDLVPKAELDSRISTAVEAEISRRTTAGELIPKDTHAQLCSVAKAQGRDGGINLPASDAIVLGRERLPHGGHLAFAKADSPEPGCPCGTHRCQCKSQGGFSTIKSAWKSTAHISS